MTTAPPPDLELQPINGKARPLSAWITNFHLVSVVVDPFTHESAWLLPTATRLLQHFQEADCRVSWIVTGTEEEARRFLGPLSDEILTFCDPDRTFVEASGIEYLPAFIHLRHDLSIGAAAEGWDPQLWDAAAGILSGILSWSKPHIPAPGDPGRYPGTPALGSTAKA